jgi:hypothetical protein
MHIRNREPPRLHAFLCIWNSIEGVRCCSQRYNCNNRVKFCCSEWFDCLFVALWDWLVVLELASCFNRQRKGQVKGYSTSAQCQRRHSLSSANSHYRELM